MTLLKQRGLLLTTHLQLALATCIVAVLLPPVIHAQEPSSEQASSQEPSSQDESQGDAPESDEPAEETSAERALREGAATFDLTLEDGSRVTGFAQEVLQEGTGGRVRLVGPTEIVYRDVKLQADSIVFDQETKDILAEGNVIFDQGPQRLAGDSLELNLDTELGRMVNAQGNAGTDYFFTGAEVIKTGDNQYQILDGQFSSCVGETPAWSFRAKRVDVTVDGYAKVRNATFRVKKAPLLYFPYILWPAKADRTSGLLVPKPGFSERRGASLGLAYYWAMNRSYDSTIHVDLFAGGAPQGSVGTGNYFGVGNEFRYRPSENTSGLFQGYGIEDPERDEFRWRVKYEHESRNLPGGMRAVIRYEDASDFDYFRDFERRGDRNSRRQLYSTGYLSGNWGSHSLNLNFDQRENFISNGNIISLRQLPELEYKMRSSKLPHTPIYMQMRTSLHYLDVQRSARLDNSYARGDIYPEFTLPFRTVPWFSFSLTAGGRYTWYGDSLFNATEPTEVRGDSDFRGESLSRFVPTANAEIVGPSFSRVFETNGKNFSKFKHVIEPRVLYSFADEDEDQNRVPLFDEVDNLIGSDRARFSLFNRLLAKPADEEQGGAFEILSLEVSQDYSFDDQKFLQQGTVDGELRTSKKGPLRTLLRYNPSRRTSLRVDASYDTLFSELTSTSLSSTLAIGKTGSLGVRWSNRVNPVNSMTTTHQVRVAARLPLGPRLRLDSQVNYDFEESLLQYQRHFLRYIGSCYTLDLEYGDFRYGTGVNERQDTEWRFSVSLKNVGTFLDLNGGDSESF